MSKVLETNHRIAIINRGEAAVRFIRAVREYNAQHKTNLKTIVYYLDVEKEARFVKEADYAYSFSLFSTYQKNPNSPYINHELLLEAAKVTSCQALWLGWGFVAEDAVFVEKIEAAGLILLGPSSKAMALLGDKIEAKKLADETNVPTVPWSRKPVESPEEGEKIAQEIGYPVIVKAAHTGGGRGIRMVHKPEEFTTQFRSARDETERITGGTVIFVEYMVAEGRHLEVQVLADRHGNVSTFGVRDCSIQRKNQKIIEETPPPDFPAEKIKAMEIEAAKIAKAANYESAGTVEFIYDNKTGNFYFMEVNTRLQVEHTITEELYGIDLVKEQINVARGHQVKLENTPRGAVLEARLNAEDPDKDFLPTPGLIELCEMPCGPGIRVDSGICEGSTIPTEFDSMVAKIIATASNRSEAIARLERALRETRIKIAGGTTNRAFLLELLGNESISSGPVETKFVEKLIAEKQQIISRPHWQLALVSCAIHQYRLRYEEELENFKQQFTRYSLPRGVDTSGLYEVTFNLHGNAYKFMVNALGNDIYHVSIDEDMVVVQYQWHREEVTCIHEGKRYNIQMVSRGDILQCEIDGIPYPLEVESQGVVRAPSPAMVIGVPSKVGQEVQKGDLLMTLEAMKMEMLVQAPEAGLIRAVHVREGEQVTAGQPLIELEETSKDEEEVPQEKAERLAFTHLSIGKSEAEALEQIQWKVLRREMLGVFLGYDYCCPIPKIYENISSFAKNNPSYQDNFLRTLIESLRFYHAIEVLFSREQLYSEGLARAATSQELMVHISRRIKDREQGLPEKFLTRLKSALECYGIFDLPGEPVFTHTLFRIYKSHRDNPNKQALLRLVLTTLEQNSFPMGEVISKTDLANVLDDLSYLLQAESQSLSDLAYQVRYSTIDREQLETWKKDRRLQISHLLDGVHEGDENRDYLIQNIVDAGEHITKALVDLGRDSDLTKQKLGLELLGKRLCRDQNFASGQTISEDDIHGYYTKSSFKSEVNHSLIFVVAGELENTLATAQNYCENLDAEKVDIMLYLDSNTNVSLENKWGSKIQQICCGFYNSDTLSSYKTFFLRNGEWQEDSRYADFSPLRFRELRVGRLENFELTRLYHSDSVFLMRGIAHDNPKDERLFALLEIPEAPVRYGEKKGEGSKEEAINRLLSFESVYMEALNAVRKEQSKRKRKLFWNRIILHIRALLPFDLKQIQEYANAMVPRTMGLGVEKVVAYARTSDLEGRPRREMEFLFEKISGAHFTMRGRIPLSNPLVPMSKYVAKVVKARQRGNPYPYQVVEMITSNQVGERKFPRGEFEEFDVIQNGDQYETVSVKNRPPAKNDSNIVFGLIRHFDSHFPDGLLRAIILGDPTKDMGSLAEEECRRIIAAIELAEKHNIPVEWVAISAGARIDMKTGTENLDWTAAVLRKIIEFTQGGGEINIIVSGINVGAQSYWNSEATMLMHNKGLLIMTDNGAMLLTGKKALDFSGSVSAEDNLGIGGVERIMGPNGEAQIWTRDLPSAYQVLMKHYEFTYSSSGEIFPPVRTTKDPVKRNVCDSPYSDKLGQGFETIGDILYREKNAERKKPFDMRQIMNAVRDTDASYLERWKVMKDAETAIVWETRLGGYAVGLLGIESRPLTRVGATPNDGPESWSGGTLFPQSSKKLARAINAFSGKVPIVVLANLSGFDGSPESLRNCQLEYGAEIGRAIVNFDGPIIFVVVARYHGGAYVVFSQSLNPNLKSIALRDTYASVIGGAPAAAVVFPRVVQKETNDDERIIAAKKKLEEDSNFQSQDFDEVYQEVYREKQTALSSQFDQYHSIERAKQVGSIHEIISPDELRSYLVGMMEEEYEKAKEKKGVGA